MSVNEMFVSPDELGDEIEFSSTDSELEIFDNDNINSRTVSTPSEFSDIDRDSFSSTNYLQDNFVSNDDDWFNNYYSKIVMEGRYLYFIYLFEKIDEKYLDAPDYMKQFYGNMMVTVTCENKEVLHKLTDQFECSAQRQWVKDQAQQINLNQLDFYSYTQKLKTLFHGVRISWEKILVIYSFCSDLSTRALIQNYEKQFERLQNWTLFFLDSYVSDWIRSEGGWDVVLNQSLTLAAKIAILSFCCLGIIVLGIYIRNNSQK